MFGSSRLGQERLVRHFQGHKAFWLSVLSKVRRDDEDVESVKWILGVMCMHRLDFGCRRCQ